MTETPDYRAGEPSPQPVEPTPAAGAPADAAPPPPTSAAAPEPAAEPAPGREHTAAAAAAAPPAADVDASAPKPSAAVSEAPAAESASEPTAVLPASALEGAAAAAPSAAAPHHPGSYPGGYPGGYYPGSYPSAAPGAPWGSPVPPVWGSAPPGQPPYGPPGQPPYGGDPQAAKARRGPGRMLVLVAVLAGLVGGGLGAGLVYAFNGGGTTVAPVAETSGSDGGNGLSTSAPNANQITAAAAKVLPSVVTITVTEANGNGDQGSGIIISSTGDILTNNHVVSAGEQGGASISVTFASGEITPAKILGTDASSDLAMIRAANVSGLPVATLGDSDSLAVGQTVVAIGAPLGLTNSVTSGIVSALNRPIFPASDGSSPSSSTAAQPVLDAIQTDAAINPGNSGGPLVNLQGQVIGIDSAILTAGTGALGGGSQSGSIGLGFAIPISQAEWIYPELIATGSASHSLLGVEVRDPSATATQTGAVVDTVSSGGPAGKAGLKSGDVIMSLNNQRIGSADALVAAVRSYKPGTTVTVTYERSGHSATAQITLATASNSNS